MKMSGFLIDSLLIRTFFNFQINLHKAYTNSDKKFIFLCDFTSLANAYDFDQLN